MSIRVKITLLFVLATLIPFLIIGTLLFADVRMSLEKSIIQKLDTLATIQKNRVLDIIDDDTLLLNLFGTKSYLRSDIATFNKTKGKAVQVRINENLTEALRANSHFKEIYIADLSGKIIGSTDPKALGTSYIDNKGFIKGKDANEVGIFFKSPNGEVSHYLAGPLTFDGKKVGVLIIVSDTKKLFALFRDYAGLGKSGDWGLTARLEDGNGVVVVPSRFDTRPTSPLGVVLNKKDTKLPSIQALTGIERITKDSVDFRGKKVITATRFIPEANWGIVVKIDQDEAFLPIASLRNQLLFYAALSILLALFLGFVLTDIITKSGLRLVAAAKRVSEGDFSVKVPVESKDEIGQIADVFNKMVASLARQKEEEKLLRESKDMFVSITAHQLRTPLGIIRWSIESLLKKKNISESMKDALNSILESDLNLISSVNDILNVVHINSGKIKPAPQKTNIFNEIEKAVEIISPMATGYEVTIKLDAKNKDTMVSIDLDLFAQVIRNVLSNAIKYNKKGGSVTVSLNNKKSEIEIEVSDTGIGIPKDDVDKLFNKFTRGMNANRSAAEGSGLGLFVVKQYLQAMGGSIRLESVENEGTTVYIALPTGI